MARIVRATARPGPSTVTPHSAVDGQQVVSSSCGDLVGEQALGRAGDVVDCEPPVAPGGHLHVGLQAAELGQHCDAVVVTSLVLTSPAAILRWLSTALTGLSSGVCTSCVNSQRPWCPRGREIQRVHEATGREAGAADNGNNGGGGIFSMVITTLTPRIIRAILPRAPLNGALILGNAGTLELNCDCYSTSESDLRYYTNGQSDAA